MKLLQEALKAAMVDGFSRPVCERLAVLHRRARSKAERLAIASLYEKQLSAAPTLEDRAWAADLLP